MADGLIDRGDGVVFAEGYDPGVDIVENPLVQDSEFVVVPDGVGKGRFRSSQPGAEEGTQHGCQKKSQTLDGEMFETEVDVMDRGEVIDSKILGVEIILFQAKDQPILQGGGSCRNDSAFSGRDKSAGNDREKIDRGKY